MKQFFLVLWMGTMSLFAQNRVIDPVVLHWKNLLPRYASFGQIKPALVNDGKHSVFLYAPYGSVQAEIERFNDKKGTWEHEYLDIICIAQAGSSALTPIKIKANSEQKVTFSLSSTAAGSTETGHIIVGEQLGEKRPLEGRYRLSVSYTLDPGAVNRAPRAWHTMYSPEFFIVKE